MSEVTFLTKSPEEIVVLRDKGESLGITITAKAMKVMHDACKEENKTYLRIGVKGGRMFGFHVQS
jgi:hypothetical protein